MTPYLDLATFKRRTRIPRDYVDQVENLEQGFTEQAIETESSPINSVLRKRYGLAPGLGNSLPFGRQPPVLVAQGTTPPALSFVGTPTLGALRMFIAITTGGVVGTAVFKWSSDAGLTWTQNVTTASQVPIGSTGLTLVSPVPPQPSTFATDNFYRASAPVPETILGWLTTLVSWAVLEKLGYAGSNEDSVARIASAVERVQKEMQDAASGKDGLWDLPINEDSDTAITTGGPMGYSEQSPYVWTTRQAQSGTRQDGSGSGS